MWPDKVATAGTCGKKSTLLKVSEKFYSTVVRSDRSGVMGKKEIKMKVTRN